MGTTCIIGVDKNTVLKDFVRAHVELLTGPKVCLEHWYPDLTHEGRTIRYFYSSKPRRSRIRKLLPHALYHRLVIQQELSPASLHDSIGGFMRHHNVDAILAEFGPTGADITPHARQLGIPLLVHFHGHDAHRRSVTEPYAERYQSMFEYASAIFSVSRFMTETLVAMGAPSEKIVYNPYGPRDAFFEVNPDYLPTILSVGRFTDIKANYLTIEAFAKVAAVDPDARLVMVGEGELLETCRTLAEIRGIADRVAFTGAIPHAQILPLFSAACCFALHSVTPSYGDAEGTPVSIIEAGAAALPVVATRHAGIPDVVIENQTGFLVDELDVNGMADRMLKLVQSSSLAREMGDNARAHVRKNFSLAQHIGRIQERLDVARASH